SFPYAAAAALLGQLIDAYAGLREFVAEFKREAQEREKAVDQFKAKLRRQAQETPVVGLLDDWDEATRFYWDSMLLNFSRDIADGLPILLFITIKAPILLDSADRDESGVTEVIRRLIEKGQAELWRVKKLSREEVAGFIGEAAPGIAAKLHG